MFGLVCATALAAWMVWWVFDGAMGLRRNVKAARESGLQWFLSRELRFLLFFFFLGELRVWFEGDSASFSLLR